MPAGSFVHADHAGHNSFRFTGTLGKHDLAPGTYRLAATPSADGLTGATRTVPFAIIR